MEKRLLLALHRRPVGRPPFWFMRQAGRYLPEYQRLRRQEPDFLRFCYTPELALEATLQPLRRFQPDAAILFSDILVVADALGRNVRFVEGQGPVLDPLTGRADIEPLTAEPVETFLAPVYKAVTRIAAALPADVALIGFAGAPWTMALYMIEGKGGTDGGRARTLAYADPEGFAALIAVLVEATVRHLSAQIRHGAEVVQLFDSWAGLLAAEEFRRWVIAPTAEIVRRLRQQHPGIPIIGFPRGAAARYHGYAAQTGVQGLGVDQAVAVATMRQLQTEAVVQGNLAPELLVQAGEAMAHAVRNIKSGLAGKPAIFNLGHGVLPQTPPAHVAQLVQLVRAA